MLLDKDLNYTPISGILRLTWRDAMDRMPLEIQTLYAELVEPTRYTLHVSGPWTITFEWIDGDAWRVDLEQYH